MRPILVNWPGGEHEFILNLGELRALQERLDSGPLEVLARLTEGSWRIDDLYEIIRLGLIGGGMKAQKARDLATARFEDTAPLRFIIPAQAIMFASLSGPGGEDEEEGEPPGKTTAPEADGTSAPSTDAAE